MFIGLDWLITDVKKTEVTGSDMIALQETTLRMRWYLNTLDSDLDLGSISVTSSERLDLLVILC